MGCNSKINTLTRLRNNKLIDERRVISTENINEVTKLINEYTLYAKKEYGVKNDLPVFSIEKSKNHKGETIRRLVPNEELFLELDQLIEEREILTVDIEEDYSIDFIDNNDVLLPSYEKTIQYKQNLVHLYENKLLQIKNDKKKYSTDLDKIEELIKQENILVDRLEGNEENNITGLKEEIAVLESQPPIHKLSFYAEKDFIRLENLVKSNDLQDLAEARLITNFYVALGTFNISDPHPLFEVEEIFNSDGKIKLPETTINLLEELKKKATDYLNLIEMKEKIAIEELINSNSKVRDTFKDKKLSHNDIFYTEGGLKDLKWADMFLMDITNGIFSHNGIAPQVMMHLLNSAIESKKVYSKNIKERVENLQVKLDYELNKAGYTFGNKYDLFRATDKNGLFKDSIVQRYTPEFTKSFNDMLNKYINSNKEAYLIEDVEKRFQAFKEISNIRNNWYRKNTILIDPSMIPEITNNPEFSQFTSNFKVDQGYVDKLKEVLGEQGYKEEISKQIKLLKEYKVALEVLIDSNISEAGVEKYEDLTDKYLYNIDNWEKKNNPFLVAQSYYNQQEITKNQGVILPTMTYNYAIPRKNAVKLKIESGKIVSQETNEMTGYYSDKFNIIENNPTFKDFHNIMLEVINKIDNSLPANIRKKFNPNNIIQERKNLNEMLADKNLSTIKKIGNLTDYFKDSFIESISTKPQSDVTYEYVDPITGKPDVVVNSEFLKNNKEEINKRFSLEFQRIKANLLKNKVDVDKLNDINLRTLDKEVIHILAENLGVESSINAIQKRLPNSNVEAFNLPSELKNAITHQIIIEQSYDLPKLIKLNIARAMEYSARQEVMPILNIIKKHYQEIHSPIINNIGETVSTVRNGKTKLEGLRVNANRQMDSWFDRVVLGNYVSVNEFGDTRLNKVGSFKKLISRLKNGKQDDIDLANENLEVSKLKKVYTKKEKVLRNKIELVLADLKEQLKDANEEETIIINKSIDNIQKQLDNLGSYVTSTAIMDTIFNFIRIKSLGWNLSSNVINFLEGQVANMITASTGDYFKPEDIYRANQIVSASILKYLTMSKTTPGASKKVSVLMSRYNILQDSSNELQKASEKSSFDKFKVLNPYNGTRRTEYMNQAPLMVARLLTETVTGKDDTVSSVWDALDNDGNLLENFATEENKLNWEDANGTKYNDFSSLMKKMIVNTHGDYDVLRGTMAGERVTGKALLMFKRWMSRQYYQRFATKAGQADIEVGMENFRGRYFSHNTGTGALQGAAVGFLLAGPIGGLSASVIGGVIGKMGGTGSSLNVMQELVYSTKLLAMKMANFPIGMFTGKQTFSLDSTRKQLEEAGISKRDINNMMANLTEISITFALVAMMILVKALFTDDDDEDEMMNLTMNRLLQVSGQASAYAVPTSMAESVGSMAFIRFLGDAADIAQATVKYAEGDDIITSGPNTGQSRLWKAVDKTFMLKGPWNLFGFESGMEKQFTPTERLDRAFGNDEDNAKSDVKVYRMEYRQQIQSENPDLSKEEVNKLVEEKYPSKKKDQTYTELLEIYENK